MAATDFGAGQIPLLPSIVMIDAIATAAMLTLVNQVSGTPYRTGGDSPSGTDCSGLASWVANAATGRPIYGDRFHTGNEEQALLARGFKYGTEPGALNIGWNSGHTAVTLPDGTPVSSGESGSGVRIGGGGAFQPQFTRHMYLPVAQDQQAEDPMADSSQMPPPFDPFAPPPPPADPFAPAPAPGPADIPAVDGVSNELPPPPPGPELPPPGPDAPPAPDAGPFST
ncbi:MAG: hypothetical protein QOJ95_343 [Mycobacterium sp.]|nr:hypothetical protein [Mycobacterium sp.]